MSEYQNTHERNEAENRGIWLRGLLMIVFAFFFGVAETLLFISAIIQFFWMLFTKAPNRMIADFGRNIGQWLKRVALFQTGASEQLPFPWTEWVEKQH